MRRHPRGGVPGIRNVLMNQNPAAKAVARKLEKTGQQLLKTNLHRSVVDDNMHKTYISLLRSLGEKLQSCDLTDPGAVISTGNWSTALGNWFKAPISKGNAPAARFVGGAAPVAGNQHRFRARKRL